jgi:hypothetical protein
MGRKIGGESGHGIGIFALGGEQHPGALEVDK